MGKAGKVVGIIFLLIVAVIAGLVAFVHYYLTEERVKALVIPQAEAALGRKVAIGDIKIGLFSGITIQDFLIKESDAQTDFVSTRAFVLSYKLLPLLQKKLIISEIRFDEPSVQITRDSRGNFNYSTLAVLSGEKQKKKEPKPQASAGALPLALTINQIRLNSARIRINDQMGEIPAVDATSNVKLNVSIGRTLQDLQYNGTFDFDAAVAYGEAKTKINGKGNIDPKDVAISLDTNLEGEQVHAEAEIKSYQQAPNATLAITSKSLNLDKLLAIVAGLPKSSAAKPQKTKAPKAAAGDVIADSLPPGLVAAGTVKVDKAIYNRLTATDFILTFDLAKGVLTVKELSAKAYGGKLDSNLTVDLNKPGTAYDGKLGLQSVEAAGFSKALVQRLAGMLTGSFQTGMTFSGAGTTWEHLRQVLTADGTFTLTDGGIKSTPVSMSIANLLGLQELNNISYKNISGSFKIVEGGKVKIKSNMQAANLDAETEGIIGLDGSLDLPLTFHLKPDLAEKLRSRASFAKYLTDDQGGATLNLKLAGNLKNPQPTLNMKGVQEQLQKSLQKEVIKQLDGSSQGSGETTSPENMIKGLFKR